jgi:precorrin-2 dehydrogenase/sirohydrochlorin ferrochelatase
MELDVSMANHYAMMVDLADKPVLMVGAGPVAEWKLSALLETGAILTVVSPEATKQIQDWAATGQLTWQSRTFEPDDLEGCSLVFAATNDTPVNQSICALACERGVWVNNVDESGRGDVIVPAQFRRGTLHIAITTGGASPVLASEISRELQQKYGPEYEAYTAFLYKCRMWLNANVEDLNERRIRTNIVLYSGLLEKIRLGEDDIALQDELWERITRG